MSGITHALFYAILVGTGVVSGLFSTAIHKKDVVDEFRELEIIEAAVETPELVEMSERFGESEYRIFGNRVTVLSAQKNIVEEMELEEYVEGVMLAEMPSWYDEEALKAAAVAIRTYTVYKMNFTTHSQQAKLCDNPAHCQAFYKTEDAVAVWGEISTNNAVSKIKAAVKETEGKILTYENEPILAMYHASSYLKTRSSSEVFGGERVYLQSVAVPFEDKESSKFSEKSFNKREFEKILLAELGVKSIENFEAVWENKKCMGLKVNGGQIISASRVRELFSLASGNFELEAVDEKVVLRVYGHGHGVGLSQQGANVLAQRGCGWEEIVMHYYKNVEISNLKFVE